MASATCTSPGGPLTPEGDPRAAAGVEQDGGGPPAPAPLAELHHLSITVSDLERSVPWYREVLGLRMVGIDDHAGGQTVLLVTVSGVVLLLQEHKAHEGASFSEFRPGLDHVSFRVDGLRDLLVWSEHLDTLGVAHPPVREEPYGSVLVFRDPDRIQIELFADPGT